MSLRSPISSPRRTGLAVLAGALLVGSAGAPAWAAPGQTSADSTVANVQVQSAISLTGLTEDFELSGLPGATITGAGAVGFNVRTNNIGGYNVTVQARAAALAPDTAGNPDSIPVGNLSVQGDDTQGFVSLSNTQAVTVHSQDTRSPEAGDDLTNDYRINIPFVNEDTYSVTLDYVATTL